MTPGLWLLALSHTALPPSPPQTRPFVAAGAAAKQVQSSVRDEPDLRFRQLGVPLDERVDLLMKSLKPEERVEFLSIHQHEISRLNIPALDWTSSNDPTSYPNPLALAATFDTDLAKQVSMQSFRDVNSASMAQFVNSDVLSDPRWGLAGSSFGEDPYLVGSMVFASVSGLRSVGALAATGRFGSLGRTTDIPNPTLSAIKSREFMLTNCDPLRLAVQANRSIPIWIEATSKIGADLAIQSQLFGKTVRTGWGATGPLIADTFVHTTARPAILPEKAGKTAEPSASPVVKQQFGTSVDCLLAGVCVFPPEELAELVNASKSRPEVANAMESAERRVIYSELSSGRFDEKSKANEATHPQNESGELALRAARESIVLLRNEDGRLPLQKDIKTLAVIGPWADRTRVGSGESGTTTKAVTPLDALKAAVDSKTKVIYEPGTGLVNREDLTIVPGEAFSDGLIGEFYDGPEFSGIPITRKDPRLEASWTGAPLEGITSKSFTARWTGSITPKEDGLYGIGMSVEGGARLYLDDELLIDEWRDGPLRTRTTPVQLKSGSFYVIRVEYLHGKSNGSVKLVWSTPQKEPFRAAIEAAIKADVVVLMLGLDQSLENAKQDRPTLGLPDSQEALLREIVGIRKPLVLVLFNGGPLTISFGPKEVSAIVEAWYPGDEGSQALAGVLTGSVNPSGKLPVTVYRGLDQLADPLNADAPRGYRNSLFRPTFSFGSGLSYTRFSYSDLSIPASFDASRPLRVYVTIKNVGKLDGEEVAELYLSHGSPTFKMPRVALKGFRRIHLAVGEKRRISFTISLRDLAVLHDDGTWWIEPESLKVSVGGNQPIDGQARVQSAHTRPAIATAIKLKD